MPWHGVSPVDLRLQFITEYLAHVGSVTALAEKYDISRKTAHYWINKHHEGGTARLAGASRRPHTMPRATADDVIEQLVAARRRHPTWGAGKLRSWLMTRAPQIAWPCRDTIHTVLTRNQLVRQRRRRPRLGDHPRYLRVPAQPNDLWTVDFKGQFRTGDGVLCYPLTLRDACSRYVLACTALPSTAMRDTRRQLLRAFATYGLPARLRSDNGPPFGARSALRGLSRLSVWLLRLGVVPEHITPGRPGENGSHEQFHAVLKRETARPPASSRAAQQRRFRDFVREYNEERPHQALNQVPPATCYAPSARTLPAHLPPLEYPLTAEIRRVSSTGVIKWHGRHLFLSGVLAQEDVAFEPTADGVWLVQFASVPLAIFHERTGRLESPSSPRPQDPGV